MGKLTTKDGAARPLGPRQEVGGGRGRRRRCRLAYQYPGDASGLVSLPSSMEPLCVSLMALWLRYDGPEYFSLQPDESLSQAVFQILLRGQLRLKRSDAVLQAL